MTFKKISMKPLNTEPPDHVKSLASPKELVKVVEIPWADNLIFKIHKSSEPTSPVVWKSIRYSIDLCN